MAEQLIIMDRNHWRFPRMRGDRPIWLRAAQTA